MVLNGLGNGLYLFRTEPLPEFSVLAYDAAGDQMVPFPSLHHSCVVVGSDGVYHIGVQFGIVAGQLHALCHHHLHMVQSVCLVEMVVSWQYLPLHIPFETGIHHRVQHLLVGLPWCAVAHIHHAATGVAVALEDMQHDVVAFVGVHPHRGALGLAPCKSALGNAVHPLGTGQPVDSAVGGGVVQPLAFLDISVGGFRLQQQGKITHCHPVEGDHMADALADVAPYQVGARIPVPLNIVAVGTHDAP